MILLCTPLAADGISRSAILLSLSIVTGGLIWKIPPLDIPHQDAFWHLTKERFWELVLFAAKLAGALILLAVIISPFYAIIAHHKVSETVLTYAAIGAVVGTGLGCLGWVVLRVLDDVEILRAESEKKKIGGTPKSALSSQTTEDKKDVAEDLPDPTDAKEDRAGESN